ncbi:hypothetical protein ACFLRT_02375 [Acidobacteriota bacterium]
MNTPKYVFDKNEIIRCYHEMKKMMAFGDVYYALKANSEIGVLEVLENIGAKFEVASMEEFNKLLTIGVSPRRIICGAPVKKIEMIRHLFSKGCNYFVFEDIRELEKLQKFAPGAQKILRVYISDIAPDSIGFGMNVEMINYYKDSLPWFLSAIEGITFHISNNDNIDVCIRTLERIEKLLLQMSGNKIKILNIGGSYQLTAPNFFFEILNEKLERIKKVYNLRVICEPGAAIVHTAGKVITEVVLVKDQDGFFDVFIDTGIPSGLNTRRPGSVNIVNRSIEPGKRTFYRFFDTTCLHRQLFLLPLKYKIMEGDIMELGNLGAYTVCFKNDFHAWKKPAVEIC